MTTQAARTSGNQCAPGGPRVGFFGLIGSGNLGNDASFEAVLTRLRSDHPEAILDAMCMGPERMSGEYGIPAIPLIWSTTRPSRTGAYTARLVWALGKGIDAWRTFRWVRRHDLVVVPGAGVLENSLPVRATGVPYAMFLLCVSGKLARVKVALLSVGATNILQRPTRWLRNGAARLAHYRSYRDGVSWEVMQRSGSFARLDPVYADLVFSLPAPPATVGDPRLVGVGIMSFFGNNDDRPNGQLIHDNYLDSMTQFVCWLVDHNYDVRLLPGDNLHDDQVIAAVMAEVLTRRPTLSPGRLVANHVSSISDLFREIEPAGFVVGSRFHNVISGLRLCKPTISVGYSLKHDALMRTMGVPEFALSARSVSEAQLTERFTELRDRSSEVRWTLKAHLQVKQKELEKQFEDLTALLAPDLEGPRSRHQSSPGPPRVPSSAEKSVAS